ncbi:hypothetical protein [Plantactinospora sp. KLBMP9567]|nr:hypothetical protein [Plantactinospora sp. KLBMP9567]MDW5330529.1 hypothetical protein [Plantactinospora sp. KLBMP9567]
MAVVIGVAATVAALATLALAVVRHVNRTWDRRRAASRSDNAG